MLGPNPVVPPKAFPPLPQPANPRIILSPQRIASSDRRDSRRALAPSHLGATRRSRHIPEPVLAQTHGLDLPRHLPRQRLRPRDDDSLLHRPFRPGSLWTAPLLAGLRLLQVRQE